MSDLKNYNVYDLVNEINKNNKSVDSKLDSLFDAIDNEDKIDTQTTVSETKQTSSVNYELKKPTFSKNGSSASSRYDRFNQYLNSINYGTNNNPSYEQGHKAAIKKYLNIYSLNEKEGYLVEATLSEELRNNTGSNDELYSKGYYDGLMYVHEALRQSKNEAKQYIGEQLRREL